MAVVVLLLPVLVVLMLFGTDALENLLFSRPADAPTTGEPLIPELSSTAEPVVHGPASIVASRVDVSPTR
jgi:hypothetical protein